MAMISCDPKPDEDKIMRFKDKNKAKPFKTISRRTRMFRKSNYIYIYIPEKNLNSY